jgi:hypothetical protein
MARLGVAGVLRSGSAGLLLVGVQHQHRDPLLGSGPLWFALVLLLYSVAFALSRRLLGDPPQQPGRPLTGAHLAGAVVVIAVCSFVVRLWFPARSSQIGDLRLWQWPQCIGLFARVLDAPAEIKSPLVGAVVITVCFWLGRHLPFLAGPGAVECLFTYG